MIERISENRKQEWKHAMVSGFAQGDGSGVVVDSFSRETIDQAIDDILHSNGYDRYLAFRNREKAGGASMCIVDRVALLTGATTLLEHRRQGVQAALLDRRLLDARDCGAEIAVITTAPGSQSQANSMRRGFALLYSRAILVL